MSIRAGVDERVQGVDLLVVGSGIAGLYAALIAAPRARVAVLTKGRLEEGCSRWAQGGIAAALADDDSTQLHYDDTIAAGRGLCHPEAVRVLVEEGPARIRQLIDWGVAFDTHEGAMQLGREAAHSRSRIAHARGDGTGLEIETTLIRRVRAAGITVVEHARIERLLTDASGRCVGAQWSDAETGATRRIAAAAVVLASGGAGRLWPRSTNPGTATGDGVALAYDAGADVAGMEFMQFHPTALALDDAPCFLISEAVRGEGGIVVNDAGRRFLLDSDPRGELAGRDIVSRAIWDELRRSGADHVYLDCTGLRDFAVRFPAIHHAMQQFGIDVTTQAIPIAPAAHYMIGGVRTDLRGATTVAGLYACGEVASSGVHGANRLASNSLLESVVFAHRAARSALADTAEMPYARLSAHPAQHSVHDSEPDAAEGWDALRAALWDGAGIVRDELGLERALAIAQQVQSAAAESDGADQRRLHAAATTATLICGAAKDRRETRGCHVRSDHPLSSDEWHGDIVMRRERGAHLDRHL